jgi:NAD-dependent SIR2 family protein deacetylase
MTTYQELKQELKNKERSINDLIRYIDTQTDQNPNYSLLMGAGCSVTSGINSANKLIKHWKKEIFIQENNIDEEDYNEIDAEEFFAKEMWYDSRNSYSSLFEKKYDLPRQRRMFIEKEVRDNSPSIGYAYLIKLVEKNYFKTLFTTNFDDLLNEAFYQYSVVRPIICAHDSAISSITVTSKRPKIIKLHGDYLFDDIKSTLRETESLEENIKNKFIEFSKDYGLIVLGYGGNDRSIIDILSYLLKNEDYFKNGIYWCLREDSEINEDLRKLLWKDRVYYVKVDGFDEVMSEINAKLNNSMLPIDSSYLNEKKNGLIAKLISNPFLIDSPCKYIKNDFQKLNKTKDRDVISNFFKYIEKNEDEGVDRNVDGFKSKEDIKEILTDDEKQTLSNLNEELFTSNFLYASTIIEEKIKDVDKSRLYYRDLLNSKAKCLRNLDNIEDAIQCYKELVELDGKNIKNYIHLSDLLEDYNERIDYIDKAIVIEPYFSKLHLSKAKILFNIFITNIDKDSLSFNLDDIEIIISKCIEVSPGISNEAYFLKFDLIKEKEKDSDIVIGKFKELIEGLEKQDKFYPEIVERKVELFNLQKVDSEKILKYIENSISFSMEGGYLKQNELILLKEIARHESTDKLIKRFTHIENSYEVDIDYWELKAKFQLEKLDQLDFAIETLKSIKVKNSNVNQLLFTYLIYKNEIQEARLINEKYLKNDKSNLVTLLDAEKDYSGALELTRILKQKKEFDHNLNILESYLLLKTGGYQEAYVFLSKCLKFSSHTEPYFLINYYIASNKYKKTLKVEKVKEKFFNGQTHSDIIQAAAYALIDDKKNAFSKLSSVIKSDYSEKYRIKDWIVFEDLFKIDKFNKLIQ